MSRRRVSHFDDLDFRRAPRKPPPESGIRMKKAGTTWWGQKWLEALTSVLRGDAPRLARGRTYARAGRVHDLTVKDGRVQAKVVGTRRYQVTIELGRLDDAAWTKAIAAMAARAAFAAELLGGAMPAQIDEAFPAGLFPRDRRELKASCTCPDWGDPCKHVAATHYVLGEALDRDPFLLFELRGRTREEVLSGLRAARGGGERSEAPQEVPAVRFGKVRARDYDRAPSPLPSMQFTFEPASHGAVLRQLGAPAGWSGEGSPADELEPLVRAGAERARRLALGEPEAPVARRRRKRME